MFNLFCRKPFALSITDTLVQVMQLSGKAENYKIVAMGGKTIPPGLVVDGEIILKDELAETIRVLMKQSTPGPIRGKECIVALCEELTYEYAFYFPQKIGNGELKKSLEEKIRLTIPIPFDGLYYDYFVYTINTVKIAFVVGIKKEILAVYKSFLTEKCGLNPIIFEPESLSIIRNWKFCFKSNQGSILVNNRGDRINWYLCWNGLIFDSNSLHVKDRDNLVRDLEQSIRSFRETTHFSVANIFIVDTSETPSWLKGDLSRFALPVESCNQKGINLKQNVPEQFDIIAGSALRVLQCRSSNFEVNLLKK